MKVNETLLAIALLCVLYTYIGYPVVMMVLVRWRRTPQIRGSLPESLSVVLTARDEPALAQRVEELSQMISEAGIRGELIVVLDGPSEFVPPEQENFRLIRLPGPRGKSFAMSLGCSAAGNEILVFADVRQTWESGALQFLLRAFSDPKVGAVSGELILADEKGVTGSVGLYWRYEKWIRKMESQFYSTVGVTGAISAVRRTLFKPLPEGLILDDVYWPLQISMQGLRTVFEERARAVDRLPGRARDEFRRKVRTLSGNFQLLQHLPEAVLPWRNPIWWQFVSHKLMRLLAPWALLALLAFSVSSKVPLLHIMFAIQSACYALAFVGLSRLGAMFRPAAAAGAFLLLNAAAWVAFWVWISGRAGRSWKRVNYTSVSAAGVESSCRSKTA